MSNPILTCPECGDRVSGLDIPEPGQFQLEPCGHDAPRYLREQLTADVRADGGTRSVDSVADNDNGSQSEQHKLTLSDVGVPNGDGESWQDVVDRRTADRPPYECVCGASYSTSGAAIKCCEDRFRLREITSRPEITDTHSVKETVRVPTWIRSQMDLLVEREIFDSRSEIHRQALADFLEVTTRE